MKSRKYDYFVTVNDLKPPVGQNKFYAKAVIHEIGVGPVDHGLGELWGKTIEEANVEMSRKIEQWVQSNEI